LVVFLVARRPRTLMALSLAIALCAVVARFIGLLAGLSWWTTYVLTPFRLDGLALGAFLAITVRQPWGPERLVRVLPSVLAAVGVLMVVTYIYPGPEQNHGIPLVAPLRSGLIQVLLACVVVWALMAPGRSVTKRFFCSRLMIFLGTYSYGLYVYHHFIFYYLHVNHTDLELARWLGSHELAVALQATAGIAASLVIAFLSYELFEKRFLKLKRFFDAPKQPAPGAVGSRQSPPVVDQQGATPPQIVEVTQLEPLLEPAPQRNL
jgi:peptidoglycan/LPS O-acetylase OafA/YrhL